MNPQVDAITLGAQDLPRARHFYEDGLGCTVVHEAEGFTAFSIGGVSSTIGLYAWDALAADARVAPDGRGFRATAMSFVVDAPEGVEVVFRTAERAGGSVVKAPRAQL